MRMNAVEIHLIINHVPIFATIFGGALILYGIFTKNKGITNTGLIIGIVAGIMVIPTYWSGHESESLVQGEEYISKEAIEKHEEIAVYGLWLVTGYGLLSAISLLLNYRRQKQEKKGNHPLVYLALIYSIGVIGLMIYIGNTGGKIRRPNIEFYDSFNPNKDMELENKDSTSHSTSQ
jgi:glucan phosphoethanolaminetransferase (alkaline phosphatase superfamily)